MSYNEAVAAIEGLGDAVHLREYYFDEAAVRIKNLFPYMSPSVVERLYSIFRHVGFLTARSQDYEDAVEWLKLIESTLEDLKAYLLKGKLAADDPDKFESEYLTAVRKIEGIADFIKHGVEQLGTSSEKSI